MMLLGLPIWVPVAIAAAPVLAAYFYRRRSRIIEVPAVSEWRRIGNPVDVRSVSTLLRRNGTARPVWTVNCCICLCS